MEASTRQIHAEPVEAAAGGIDSLPFLSGVPHEALTDAIRTDSLRLERIGRDTFIQAQGGESVAMVIAGQLAAGYFEEAQLAERRAYQDRLNRLSTSEREEESILDPPPLARTATKNVALFRVGDVLNPSVRIADVAYYTVSPATVLWMRTAWIADAVARYPFLEERFRRAQVAGRARLAQVVGLKQEVLDFYVRHGVSVSGDRIRVRQLALCIDCKQCEDACEERHGARRLTLSGYHLGVLDVVYTCRTCSDQRCVDPCAYDSIKYDPQKREVVINESTCTGCTACAQACPYGAIDMVDVEDPKHRTYKTAFKARLDKREALAFGPGTGRVVRARRIANKCDHCSGYHDQACVSACPTGSLVELDGYELFDERSPTQLRAGANGFVRDEARQSETLPLAPFIEGVGERSGGDATIRRRRLVPLVMWVVAWVVWIAALAEVLLRLYRPTWSFRFDQLRGAPQFAGLPEAHIVEQVTFRAGDQFSVWLGVGGTALMLVAAIYPAFRRVRVFRWLAANTMWFDIHLMAGLIGPLFVVLHSALRLGSWVSIPFWTMMIVVVSGVMGRYLYSVVPALTSGLDFEQLDHERALTAATGSHPQAVAFVRSQVAAYASECEAKVGASLFWAVAWLRWSDVTERFRRPLRRLHLRRFGLSFRAAGDLNERLSRLLRMQRRRVVTPKAHVLLTQWKSVHVVFTILLTVTSAAHIVLSWSRAW